MSSDAPNIIGLVLLYVTVLVIVISYNSMKSSWCKTSLFENWINEHRRDPFDYYMWRSMICKTLTESEESKISIMIFDSSNKIGIVKALQNNIIKRRKILKDDGKYKYHFYSAKNEYILFGDLYRLANITREYLRNDEFIMYHLGLYDDKIYAAFHSQQIWDIIQNKMMNTSIYGLDESVEIRSYSNSILQYVYTCSEGDFSSIQAYPIRSRNTVSSVKSLMDRETTKDIRGRFSLIGSPCLSQKDLNSLMTLLVATNFMPENYSNHFCPKINHNISIKSDFYGEQVYITHHSNGYLMYWLIYNVPLLTIYFSLVFMLSQFTNKVVEPKKVFRYTDGSEKSFYIWTPALISTDRSNMGILKAYFLHRSYFRINFFDFANLILSGFCLSFFFIEGFPYLLPRALSIHFTNFTLWTFYIALAYVITIFFVFCLHKTVDLNIQWFSQLQASEQLIWICSLPLAVFGCLGLKKRKVLCYFFLPVYFWITSYQAINFYFTYSVKCLYNNLLTLGNTEKSKDLLMLVENWFPILFIMLLYIKGVISSHKSVYNKFIKDLIDFLQGDDFQLPHLDQGVRFKRQAVLLQCIDRNRNLLLIDECKISPINCKYKTTSGAMVFYKEDGEICITAQFFFGVMDLPGTPFSIKRIMIDETLSLFQRSLTAIVAIWILVYVLNVPVEGLRNKSETVKVLMFITQTFLVKLYSDIFFKITPREKINISKQLGFQKTLIDYVRNYQDEFIVFPHNKWDVPFDRKFTLVVFFIACLVFIIIQPYRVNILWYLAPGTYGYPILIVFSPLFCFFTLYLQST